MDSNHRPHAYQACALTRLSYRPFGLVRLASRINSADSPLLAIPGKWWTRPGSNRRPPGCKPGALPAELRARYWASINTHTDAQTRSSKITSVFKNRIEISIGSVDLSSPLKVTLLRKEVIQPQVLLQLPCYDFTPITKFTIET